MRFIIIFSCLPNDVLMNELCFPLRVILYINTQTIRNEIIDIVPIGYK